MPYEAPKTLGRLMKAHLKLLGLLCSRSKNRQLWVPISSLTSVVCVNRLHGNEIQGQSQRKDSKDGGAAEDCPIMLRMIFLAFALDFFPRQRITTD